MKKMYNLLSKLSYLAGRRWCSCRWGWCQPCRGWWRWPRSRRWPRPDFWARRWRCTLTGWPRPGEAGIATGSSSWRRIGRSKSWPAWVRRSIEVSRTSGWLAPRSGLSRISTPRVCSSRFFGGLARTSRTKWSQRTGRRRRRRSGVSRLESKWWLADFRKCRRTCLCLGSAISRSNSRWTRSSSSQIQVPFFYCNALQGSWCHVWRLWTMRRGLMWSYF